MRLKDTIEVLDSAGTPVAELACHISMDKVQAVEVAELDRPVLVEVTSVIMKPTDYATPNRRYRWRDRDYIQRADPRVRRRNGKDHHYTVELTRI